jgi:hypothetical protein
MRFEVTFYRDGGAAATVEVGASFDEHAVKTALAGGQVPDHLGQPMPLRIAVLPEVHQEAKKCQERGVAGGPDPVAGNVAVAFL